MCLKFIYLLSDVKYGSAMEVNSTEPSILEVFSMIKSLQGKTL